LVWVVGAEVFKRVFDIETQVAKNVVAGIFSQESLKSVRFELQRILKGVLLPYAQQEPMLVMLPKKTS
jgi:hypothetical protein